MTFLDPNNPTPSELEALRVECAKEVGWVCDKTGGWNRWSHQVDENSSLPFYSSSYDAILPEVQKMNVVDALNCMKELKALTGKRDWVILFHVKPWQLALALLRVKQQNKKEL